MKNYIPENIEYLTKLENSSKDEFGFKFDLKRGIVSQYVRKISIPKLETIQRICLHFNITIDDFINSNLSEVKNSSAETKKDFIIEPPAGYGYFSLKYVELLEKSIEDKDKIISALEGTVDPGKSKTA